MACHSEQSEGSPALRAVILTCTCSKCRPFRAHIVPVSFWKNDIMEEY